METLRRPLLAPRSRREWIEHRPPGGPGRLKNPGAGGFKEDQGRVRGVGEEDAMNRGLSFVQKRQTSGYQPPMVYVYEDARWAYRRLDRDLAHEDLLTEEEMNILGA